LAFVEVGVGVCHVNVM